jgi:SAM-dependent methyltransferase
MGIAETAAGLHAGHAGIWTSDRAAGLSYPEDGNACCFALEDQSYWFEHRNHCIAAVVRRFPPQGCILDVGGGNGYVTKRLLEEGFDATLLEPGAVGAWNGKVHRKLPEVICSTVADAGFRAGSVPAVGCFDVIEHMADDRAFARQLHAVLIAGGLLYATVPAHRWLWSRSDVAAEHHRRYDRTSFMALLDATGFEALYFSYFFAPLLVPMLLLRALPFRIGLGGKRGMLLSDAAEHGAAGGIAASAIKHVLRGEVASIGRGVEAKFGASALCVARKRI